MLKIFIAAGLLVSSVASAGTVYLKTVQGQIVEVSRQELAKVIPPTNNKCRGMSDIASYGSKEAMNDGSVRFVEPRVKVQDGRVLPLITDNGLDIYGSDLAKAYCAELGYDTATDKYDGYCSRKGISEGAIPIGGKFLPHRKRDCTYMEYITCK